LQAAGATARLLAGLSAGALVVPQSSRPRPAVARWHRPTALSSSRQTGRVASQGRNPLFTSQFRHSSAGGGSRGDDRAAVVGSPGLEHDGPVSARAHRTTGTNQKPAGADRPALDTDGLKPCCDRTALPRRIPATDSGWRWMYAT